MCCFTKYHSPLGTITLACDEVGLIGLWIEGQKYHWDKKDVVINDNMPIFTLTKKWLDRYFAGQKPEIKGIPLSLHGSEFRKSVWAILCSIPYGQVTTYGAIATQIAVTRNRKTMSAQAIGGAVAHNPISIIIPCHRVVGSTGSLTGYAGGINLKIKLLELEGADFSGLFMPKKKG